MYLFRMHVAGKAVFGPGSLRELPSVLESLGVKRPFLVTDGNMVKLRHADRVFEVLREAKLEPVGVFDGVEPEPSVETTDAAAEMARASGCDGVIGLGGGSCMDVAKAVAVLVKNEGSAADYQGLDLVKKPGVPKVMIPTTAGTGSEVTFTAVLTRKRDGVKAGINDPKLFPEACVLDPELTLSMPPRVTASSGMDALVHALESFVSRSSSPFSEMFSLKAIEMIARWIYKATYCPRDLEARSQMLLASYYGGIALANAGVGLCHSLAYPLGSDLGVPHGVANALLIPYVVDYNCLAEVEKYSLVFDALLGQRRDDMSRLEKARSCADLLLEMVEALGLPTTLSALGVGANLDDSAIERLAQKAMAVKRPIENNPRTPSLEDCVEIYKKAL